MKKKNIVVLIFLVFLLSIYSCKTGTMDEVFDLSLIEATYSFSFPAHDEANFEIADGWTNGGFFDATWRRDQVTFDENSSTLALILDHDVQGAKPEYKSGEYRSRDFYHYGLYQVRMKVAKGDGIVSSFFTYTGPSDSNPWDEIDIEILGKDTTKMQTNYFTNGVGNKEAYIDLGFDASESFNDYAFEWLPDEINWFVNGVLVHTENGSRGAIPNTPSKIMVNLWPGTGVDGWTGAFDDSVLPVKAEYAYIKYTPYTISPIIKNRSLQSVEQKDLVQSNPGVEIIKNGDFSTLDSKWALGLYEGGDASFNAGDNHGLISISSGGNHKWSVQLIQGMFSLKQGESYILTFEGKAEIDRSIEVNIGQGVNPWASYSGANLIELSNEWKNYVIEFTHNDKSVTDARVEFNSGVQDADISLRNISMMQK